MTQEDFNEMHHHKSCNSKISTVKVAFKVSQKWTLFSHLIQ